MNGHWAFDLLYLDAKDVRGLPLVERNGLRLSETFDDGAKLLAAAEQMDLEGVVSKRRAAPYRSGSKCGWTKVKTQAWREANRERWRLFEQRR